MGFPLSRRHRTRGRVTRRRIFLALALLLVAGGAAAQPACEAAADAARAALDRFYSEGDRAALDVVVERARAARACFGPGDFAPLGRLFNWETYALVELRRHDEARAAFDAFFRRAGEADADLVARMYWRSAHAARQAGTFALAQQHYARAAALGDALPVHQHVTLLLDQATSLAKVGAFEQALAVYDVVEVLLGRDRDHPRHDLLLGRTLWDRADVLSLLAHTHPTPEPGLLRQSIAAAEEAARLLDGPDPETTRQRVYARLVLADALAGLGRGAEALGLTREAAREAEGHPSITFRIEALEELGEALVAEGQPAQAAGVLRRALAIAEEHDEAHLLRGLAEHLGAAHEALGEVERAEDAYRRALAVAEAHRASLGTTEWAASAFSAWQKPHRRLAGLLLRQGRHREAFLALDATRARYLRDLRTAGRLLAGSGAAERDRLDALLAEAEALRDSLFEMEPGPRHLALQTRLNEIEAERGRALRPDGEADALTLPDLQRALARRGQALLTYSLDAPAHAFLVRPDTFLAVPLAADRAEVQAQINAISTIWTRPAVAPDRDAIAFETAPLVRLYELLFAPVTPHLEPGTPLVVVPDEPLSQLPFAMLLEREPPRFQYADAPFLLRRHPISTELAAALLLEPAPARAPLPLDVLAVGVSAFSGAGADVGPGTRLRQALEALPDLPLVADEIAALRRRFRRGAFALDAEATETLLRRHLPEARVVHLASHATVYPDYPLYNAVLLAPDTARSEDGFLHLYELAGQRLPAELVVLSGCSTARGRIQAGEGMMGLQYGFRAAGAHAALAMLWPVDDAATLALMDRFYAHLRGGLRKDEALRRAQLDYLGGRDGLAASPFFWAAPVLYGDAAPLDLHGGHFPWTLAGLFLVLAALILPRVWDRRSGRTKARENGSVDGVA